MPSSHHHSFQQASGGGIRINPDTLYALSANIKQILCRINKILSGASIQPDGEDTTYGFDTAYSLTLSIPQNQNGILSLRAHKDGQIRILSELILEPYTDKAGHTSIKLCPFGQDYNYGYTTHYEALQHVLTCVHEHIQDSYKRILQHCSESSPDLDTLDGKAGEAFALAVYKLCDLSDHLKDPFYTPDKPTTGKQLALASPHSFFQRAADQTQPAASDDDEGDPDDLFTDEIRLMLQRVNGALTLKKHWIQGKTNPNIRFQTGTEYALKKVLTKSGLHTYTLFDNATKNHIVSLIKSDCGDDPLMLPLSIIEDGRLHPLVDNSIQTPARPRPFDRDHVRLHFIIALHEHLQKTYKYVAHQYVFKNQRSKRSIETDSTIDLKAGAFANSVLRACGIHEHFHDPSYYRATPHDRPHIRSYHPKPDNGP